MLSLVPTRHRPQVPASRAAADLPEAKLATAPADAFSKTGPSQFPKGHAHARAPDNQTWGLAALGQLAQTALKAPAVGAVLLALTFGGTAAMATPAAGLTALPTDHSASTAEMWGSDQQLDANVSGRIRPAALDQALMKASRFRLKRGAKGPNVRALQDTLSFMGYPLGKVDAAYGGMTANAVRVFQIVNDLRPTGEVGEKTWEALMSPDAVALPVDGSFENLRVYRPNTAEAFGLFLGAAQRLGVPPQWAISPSLHSLLQAESNGEVGRPNYTYGRRTKGEDNWQEIHSELKAGRKRAKSSATGLGQLILANVERHYPSGAQGIGNPMEEAIGMLSYIKTRHRDPDRAWGRYNSVHEGY